MKSIMSDNICSFPKHSLPLSYRSLKTMQKTEFRRRLTLWQIVGLDFQTLLRY
ncbi:MAG: hypothetical protein LBO74_15625 [Candidatus Symbiothrix sp.]|jgi:hypothetical protein|nr:hypothetical protein [Candidatus Symbiothrix sp.]